MSTPLFALSTTSPAGPSATITIDGEPYRLRTRATMSVAQHLRYHRVIKPFRDLHIAIESGEATDAQDSAYKQILADLAVMAIDAPEAVVRSLDFDAQLVVVSAAFFGMRPTQEAGPDAKAKKQPATKKTRRRGGRSSRD